MAGPFDAYFDQLKQREASTTAARVRLDPMQPDQAADGLATAKELGLPAGQVMAFPELFKDKLAQKRATTALTEAPKLSDWLRADPVNGALAKDDLENLSWFERTLKGGVNAARRFGLRQGPQLASQYMANSTARAAGDSERSFGEILQDERDPRMVDGKEVGRGWIGPGDVLAAADRWAYSRVAGEGRQDFQAAAQAHQFKAGRIADRIAQIQMTPGGEAAKARIAEVMKADGWQNQLRDLGKAFVDEPGNMASFLLQFAAESAPAIAVGTAVGALTRSPAAAARVMSLSSGTSEYGSAPADFFAEKGIDIGTPEGALAAVTNPELMREAENRGVARALVIGMMDGLSGGIAGATLAKNPVGNMVLQSITQMFTGAGGEAAAQYAAGQDFNVVDVVLEGLAEMVTAPADVAGMAVSKVRRARAKGEAAEAGAHLLDEVSAQAQASKVRERSPEAFKAALDQSGVGDQMVYVPAQALREFFQARDLTFDAEAAQLWGIDPDTFGEMEISGGRIAVPMSNFAAYLSGTDAEAWVRENATMEADDLSLAEAKSFADLVPEDASEAYDRQISDMRDDDAARSSDQQVFDGFYSQLREAGRTSDVADKEARVMSAFFRSMADRTNDDALDLAQRFGLRIQGPDGSAVPRRRGSLDVMLNDLRAGRKEAVGRSLTRFVIDAGGVQDVGGDVGAIEGPRGLVAESADEVRARQSQPTLDGVPARGQGLQLDELGRMAVEAGYFPELMGEVQGLNDGEAADLGAALLEGLRDEAGGNMRYAPGEGPDPNRAALNDALQARGIDPAEMSNDQIAAALDQEPAGTVYGQDGVARTESAAFKSWFGDSKVVRPDGSPMVVYHGTRSGIEAFDPGASPSGNRGLYASPNASYASAYAGNGEGAAVYPVYMSIQKPLIIEAAARPGLGRRVAAKVSARAADALRAEMQQASRDRSGLSAYLDEGRVEALKAEGYDGIINRESNEVVAFDPTQIKSVNNGGGWSAGDPRILNQSAFDKGGRGATADRNVDTALSSVTVEGSGMDRSEARESARGQVGRTSMADGTAAEVTWQGVKKIYSNRVEPIKAGLAARLGELVSVSVPYSDVGGVTYAAASVMSGGKEYAVRLTFKQAADAKALYHLEGFEVAPAARPNAVSDQTGLRRATTSNSTVADMVSIFNANDGATRPYFQERRGSIQFPAGGPDSAQTVINLFESSDLSTFMHESGHFFLETMDALARDPAAPTAIREEMAAVRSYLGADDGAAFTTEQHETFARSFEAYLMEGKAPSLALADVFARVKAWLTRIYRNLSGLNVNLSPEIREVFDRILATDAEIAQVRAETSADPLFRDKPPGMTDSDWKTYQRMARRSREQAEAKLLDKTMAKVRREKEAWWKAERKQVREEVDAYMTALPQYRLVEFMANGRILSPEGDVDAADVRISRKDLVEQFGAGVLAELSRERLGGKRAIYADEGLPPNVVSEMFGFSGPAPMVQILQNTTKRADAINAETDRIMLERYGDPMTDGTVEQEALDAIHNDQQAMKNVAEARHMASQLGRDTRGMTATLYKQRARLMLGRMTVREAAAPNRFLAAERRAGREAERAFAKVVRGDASALAGALLSKEQQILNAALYDLSRQAEADVGKAREKMQAYGKKSIREKLEGGYIEQIDDLLDRYDFRRRSPGQVEKTERMREFVDRMIGEGREAELMIDPRMMDDARRVHYSRLPLEEFRALLDTVANLDHLGRFKQKLIDARRSRDLQETATAISDAIVKNVGSGRIKQESRGRYLLDLVLTADTVLVDVDGGDEFGTAYQAIKEDIDAGYVRVDAMNRELSLKLSDLFKVYSPKEIRAMKADRHINGTRFNWSKWRAIAVAMNTGNNDNMARLLAPDAHPDQRLSQADLDAVLDTLDRRDWDFVQSMWDLINSYWGEIEAVTQRRTGVKPGKVEGRQVATKFGTYPGGYYPIRYDAGYGHAAAVDARTEMDNFMSAGRFAKAQTKHGHTIERKATGNGRTLNLDMDVAFTHLRDVVRDIALSEAVDGSYRLLNHRDVAQAFMDAGRRNDLDMMNLWLKDVAQGPIVHSDPVNMFARIVKNNFTLSRLALNLKTAALQMTGVAQSAATVGKANMAHSFADYMKRPAESSREVMAKSEFMRRRQTTFDKDINDFANDAKIISPIRGRVASAAEVLGRVGFAPLTKVQFYAVDVPTWMAGYRTGLRKFEGDDDKAVSYADRMVARAQDSGAMPDRSAISRGTVAENARQVEWIKLFTTLQGYMIAKFNRGYLTAKQGARNIRQAETVAQRFAATADMATNMMLIYVAETAMMGLAYAAMAELGDDDDKPDREKFFTWMSGEVVGTVVGGFPIVRDGWSVLSNPAATGGGVYGSVTEIPAKLWTQAVQGENDRSLRRAVADAVGTATGLPTTALMRPIEEMMKESDERSLIEAMMGRNPLSD